MKQGNKLHKIFLAMFKMLCFIFGKIRNHKYQLSIESIIPHIKQEHKSQKHIMIRLFSSYSYVFFGGGMGMRGTVQICCYVSNSCFGHGLTWLGSFTDGRGKRRQVENFKSSEDLGLELDHF